MSLTSYRAAPPRVRCGPEGFVLAIGVFWHRYERDLCVFLSRFGGDLLSRVLRRSTIGATALNGRVREGTGCFARAMTTKPRKKHAPRVQVLACVSWRFIRFVPSLCLLLTVPGEAVALLFLDQIKPIGQLVPVS